MKQFFDEPSILSANLCTEPLFATQTLWTGGLGWSYDTPIATTDGQATTLAFDLGVSAIEDDVYTVTVELIPTTTSAVGLTMTLGGAALATTKTAAGMFTVTGTCGVGDTLVFSNALASAFIGSISKVIVKRHI